jgi:hypothetical protein
MGVVDFERNILRQKEIEVQALVALMKYSSIHKKDAERKLYDIAFPDYVAKKINQEKII